MLCGANGVDATTNWKDLCIDTGWLTAGILTTLIMYHSIWIKLEWRLVKVDGGKVGLYALPSAPRRYINVRRVGTTRPT
jgi:hypothetical protein